jgi:hypothetical protein
MDWWLSTIGNILQIITSISFFGVALKWGRNIMKNHNILSGVLLLLLAASVVVSSLSLVEKMGLLPTQKITIVRDRHFDHEEVVLDYNSFYDCIFENVKFRWGGGEFSTADVKIIGPYDFEVTDIKAAKIIAVMYKLGVIVKQPQASFHLTPALP